MSKKGTPKQIDVIPRQINFL